jgi:hypothetical protein
MPRTVDAVTFPDHAGELAGTVPVTIASLAGWTGDELLVEAVRRSAGDPPALRLMQGVILAALLAAHDRRQGTDPVAS